MARTGIRWDQHDDATPALIAKFGGPDVVERAVSQVLPGRQVDLRVLSPGISGSVVFLASPVTFYDNRRVSEVNGVLKVGSAKLLADEVDRYERWVARILLHASHFAPLDHSSDLQDIAKERPEEIQALHYRHVGHTTFGQRVRDLIVENDGEALNRLIDSLLVVLRPWQELGEPIMSKSLTSDGVYSFTNDPFPEFMATCSRLNAVSVADGGDRIDETLVSRIGDFWDRDALGAERQLQTILHGDLHVDNILVDANDAPTLIDFGATGEGHFLRDLSTLEAHLVLRTMAPRGSRIDLDQRNYLAELGGLYSPQAFLAPQLDWGDSLVVAAVSRLRRYALYCLMRGEVSYMAQYAMGVLRHSIRLCTRPDDAYSDAQRWVAAHVASMLRSALAVENHRLIIRHVEPRHVANGLSFLDDRRRETPDPDGLNAPLAGVCSDEQWTALARFLRSAQRIDFIGVVPPPLVSALLVLWNDDRTATSAEGMPLPRYVTLPGPMPGSPIPNWRVALNGMRNVANIVLRGQTPMDRFAQVSDSVSTNCVIRARSSRGGSRIFYAGQLTAPGQVDSASTLTELPDDDGRMSDIIERTFESARPLIMREVDCHPWPEVRDANHGADPEAFRLSAFGDPTPRTRCLRPIALTILRTRGPGGRQVLVKVRSPLTDYDDFGRISFLSARILVEDILQAHGEEMDPAEDAEDAFVELWERIGRPEPFYISDDVFVQAARRDVYETTLLELGSDRFAKRGFQIMDREDRSMQLYFAVLTVDLEPSEVSVARRTGQAIKNPGGPLLRVMSVDELLSGRHPVNRIMRDRKEWLLNTCLGRDIT